MMSQPPNKTNVDAQLEILPSHNVIEFFLSSSSNHESKKGTLSTSTNSKTVALILKHPDPDSYPIAFKVRCTKKIIKRER